MADIVMSYIIIKKKDNDGINIKEKVETYLMNSGYEFKGDCFLCEDDRINYEIKHKKDSDRYYVKLQSIMRFNKGVKCLQRLDECLTQTDFKRYANIERDFDGVSAALSEKLYPLYSQYERRIRQLILLVLTKAFGCRWIGETFSEEQMKSIKERAKGKLTDILENLDLKEMENYLFEKNTVDYINYYDVILTKEKTNNMTKAELLKNIENMRPKSLWETNFSEIGFEDEWKKSITEVHDCRNKVAHHKRITIEEYKIIRTRLKRLNNKISIAIDNIQNKDFSDNTSINVLGGFGIALSRLSKAVLSLYDVSDVINAINSIVQQIVKPIRDSYSSDAMEAIKIAASNMAMLNKPEYMNRMILEKQEEYSRIGAQLSQSISSNLSNIPRMDLEAIGMAETMNKVASSIYSDT